MHVGIGPGQIALDGDQAPFPQRGRSPQFLTHIRCSQMAEATKMPLGIKVGIGPGDFVVDGDPDPLPKKGAVPPIFGPCLLWPNDWMDQDRSWH